MARLDQAGIDRIVRQELAYQRLETRIAELRELLYGNLKPDIETPKPPEERRCRVWQVKGALLGSHLSSSSKRGCVLVGMTVK